MAKILVTDGSERAALAVVRSLGQAGHQVIVTSRSRRSLAGASRYARHEGLVADPLHNPNGFLEAIARISRTEGVDLIVPVSEASALALLDHRDRLAPASLPFPSADSFRRVVDKSLVLEQAQAMGISNPTLGMLRGVDDAAALANQANLPFPVVLKPSRSVVESGKERVKTGVVYALDHADLLQQAGSLAPEAFPVLVQRRIRGPGIGVFLLLEGGEVIAHFGHRRIREKPPSGGVSVLRESVQVPEALLQQSADLLRSFDWEGVAMIEYKVDQATGQPYLMEINGRFWGSLQLAVDAGVDFPRLLADSALDGTRGRPPEYRVGVRSRWFWGDVDHLLARMLKSREELGLDASAPGRLRVVADFLAGFLPPTRGEVFRLGDPFPGVLESMQWLEASLLPRHRARVKVAE